MMGLAPLPTPPQSDAPTYPRSKNLALLDNVTICGMVPMEKEILRSNASTPKAFCPGILSLHYPPYSQL